MDSGWRSSKDGDALIGDAVSPARMTVEIDQDITTETVQFSLKTTHQRPKWLLAKLISPQGTVSHVLTPLSGLRDMDDLPHEDFAEMTAFEIPLSSSNAFFGEQARGIWTLMLVDLADSPEGAALTHFDVRVTGH